MHPVLQKTLGGLSPQYYFRQLFFGGLIGAFPIFMASQGGHSTPIGMYFFIIISALLYPYSRFVYESIVGFVMGDNIFFVNVFLMFIAKLITMTTCFCFAIFIAPIGLTYLYFHHSKAAAR